MFKDNYSVKHSLKKLFLQRYERYLPTAFDESMSLLEKMNTLIESQNSLIDVVNTHVEFTSDQLERAFGIIDENITKELKAFRDELVEQTQLYENIRDKIHSDLLPDNIKRVLEEWLLDGTIENLINDEVFTEIISRLQEVELKVNPEFKKVQIRVPGDFDTLQEAVDYGVGIKNGVEFELLILRGFRPSKGIKILDEDAKHIVIKSEDNVVTVANDFTGDFMDVYNGSAPHLNCLIDMNDKGAYGYRIQFSSSATVESGGGVINAGEVGVYVRTSTMTAPYSKFGGSNDRGAWITRGSNVSFGASDFSGIKGGLVGVYVSRGSIADFSLVNLSNCGSEAVVNSLRSKVALMDADISNAKGNGIFASSGAEIAARTINIKNCNGYAIYASNGATIDLGTDSDVTNASSYAIRALNSSKITGTRTKLDGCGASVVYADNASTVSLREATALNCKYGITVINGSQGDFPLMRLSNTENGGVMAKQGSRVSCPNIRVTGAKGYGLDADQASTINALGCSVLNTQQIESGDTTGSGVSSVGGSTITVRGGQVKNSARYDLRHQFGGIIAGHSCETTSASNGQPSLNDTTATEFNVASRNGIIFA